MSLGSTRIGGMNLGSTPVFRAGSGPTPPAPPVFVDYIETDGVAYINTGIKGNVPLSMKLYFTPVLPSSTYSVICGCRKDQTQDTRLYPYIVYNTKKITFCYGTSFMNATLDVASSIDNKKMLIAQARFMAGEQILYKKQDGETSYANLTSLNANAITNDIDIFLFCQNNYGSPSTIEPGTRVNEFQIYSDYSWTQLVFYGKACFYNGKYGLWDSVTNSFFGNAAPSGAFTGPSIQ